MPIGKKRKMNPKSLNNLKPFKPGQDPRRNTAGTPKSTLKELEERIGVSFGIALSKGDKYQIIESLLETPIKDLKRIVQDESAPVFLVNVAAAIVSDTQRGETTTLDKMLDRFFGRARQESVIIGDKENPVFVNQESTLIYMPANGRD
jgi:hypothetical protein